MKKSKRYCDIRATSLEEIKTTCERHIRNIGMTQADLIDNEDGTATDNFYIGMFRGVWQDLLDDVNEMLRKQNEIKPLDTPFPKSK